MLMPTETSPAKYSGAVGLLYITVIGSMLTLGYFLQSSPEPQLGIIASQLLCIALPAFIARQWLKTPEGEQRGKWGTTIWIVLSATCTALFANASTMVIAETIPAAKQLLEIYQSHIGDLLRPEAAWRQAAALGSIVIVAPLCEEFCFRGTMLAWQRKTHSMIAAIAINGFLFALMHLNPVAFLALWMTGSLFAYIAWKTGKLWTAILAHATFNFVNGVPASLLDPSLMEPNPAYIWPAFFVGLILATGSWFFLSRSLRSA